MTLPLLQRLALSSHVSAPRVSSRFSSLVVRCSPLGFAVRLKARLSITLGHFTAGVWEKAHWIG